ncbi:MAG: Rpn family recombination-promoting nuclease/putative transposase, partial [Planctomycetota bacterium]
SEGGESGPTGLPYPYHAAIASRPRKWRNSKTRKRGTPRVFLAYASGYFVLDVRARDAAGRWLNIEIQVSLVSGLTERLVYYACSLYVEQLESGQSYANLKPAISICLLNRELFRDSSQAHHRFQLLDRASNRELPNSVEVHTVELTNVHFE